MNKQSGLWLMISVFLLGWVGPAIPGTITYQNPGTIAPTTHFTGDGGDVYAYFLPDTASYHSNMSMYVNGVQSTAGWVFSNHNTTSGSMVDLGYAAAGSSIVFALQVFGNNAVTSVSSPNPHYVGTPIYTLYSDPALNTLDHINHTYSTSYPGSSSPNIPAGNFVAFEDELYKVSGYTQSDLNYNDEDFVVTNDGASSTPEPTTFTLLGIGIACMAGYGWRRRKLAAP